MEDEFDEFGIPIKKPTGNKQEVDEFGIPLKKKDVSESTSQNQELDSKQEVGSSDGVKSDNPVVEFIKNPPVTVSNPESEAGKEYLSIKQEYENRPPMQVNHDDLLARISKLKPQEKKSSLELKIQDVDKVRKEIQSTEAKANALARVTGKEPIDILKGNENYKQLKLKETRIKGNDFVTTFGSNLFNGSAGISGTPNAIVESLGRLLVGTEDYEKIPESDRENFFSELLSNIPINNLGALGKVSLSGNKRQKELLKDSEKLREIATKYDSAITEDIGNMDLAQAGKRIAVEGVGSIPSLIQAVIPYVGIASIVTGSAANKLEENKDSKGIGKDDVVDAWINGASEGLLEAVSKGLATKMFKSFGPIAKEEARTLSKSLVDNLIYSPLKEGGSEAATEIVNKLSDAFVLGNEQDIQENIYGILDSFVIGGFVGGAMGSVTALGENIKLNKKAIDGDVDSQMKVEQINELQSNIENSKQSIENVNSDEKLSLEEKTKIISELENSIKENTSSIEEILGVEVEAKKETKTNAEKKEATTEATEQLVEETTPEPETGTKEGEVEGEVKHLSTFLSEEVSKQESKDISEYEDKFDNPKVFELAKKAGVKVVMLNDNMKQNPLLNVEGGKYVGDGYIVINPEYVDKGYKGTNTIQHESAHAYTSSILMEKDMSKLTPQEVEFVDGVKSIFKSKKTFLDSDYGFKNEREFVAEFLSNPEFRNKVQGKDLSLFDKIKQYIAKFINKQTDLKIEDVIDSFHDYLSHKKSNKGQSNETTPAQDTTTDGDVQPRTDANVQQGQDANIQPTVESETNTAEVQQTTVKRINPKGVKGEFDVEIDENGSVKSIKSKDGKDVPKFVDRKVKKTKQNPRGLKAVKNANYSRIEAEAVGTKTENAIKEEEAKKTNEAVSSFEPTNEYEAALKSLATGSKVSLKSSNRETRLSQKETKWASGFNKDSDLPSIEALAENIVQDSNQELDVQEVRNALIDIISTNSSIDNVKSKIIDIYTENSTKQKEEELYQYKNSLSEQDLAKFEAIKAEDDYLSELSYEDKVLYYEEQFESKDPKNVGKRESSTTGIQERTGEKETESKPTKEEQSKIDKFEKFLKKADADLKKFGDETLGINLPIAIARTAVKAMLVSVKTAKNTAQIIKAGVEAIKETSWYKKLTDAEKADINEATIEGLIKSSVDETNQMSNEDAKKLYEETVDKADKALEGDKDYKKKRRNTIRSVIQAYSDRQFVPKKLMDEIGAQSVKDLMINSHGASGKAKRFFEDSYSKIYDKLNSKDRELLDKFIQLRRIVAIDENRVTKDLPEILHPDGMDMVKAKKVLEQYKSEIGDKKFEDLNKRSDEYFKAYSKLLDDTFKNGLISKETYNSLNGLDYQPRLFIEHITDFEGNVSLGGKSTDKGDTGGLSGGDIIKTLKEGSEGSLIRNSEWLLSTSIVARARAIAMNNINKQFISKEYPNAKKKFEVLKEDVKNKKDWTKEDKRFFEYFTELDSKVKINEIVGYKKIKVKKDSSLDPNTLLGNPGNNIATDQDIKNGEFTEIEVPIFKYDKTPKNFKKAYWYENGVRNEFFLEEGFHDQWFDNFLRLPGKYKEALSYGSGSALIKAIATGNNPAFAIVNTPRDFMYTAVFSDQYSSVVPKAMFQVAKDTFKAIKEIKKSGKGNIPNNLFEKYIEYGGDMAFLSTQGRLKRNTELGKIVDKSISKKTRDIGKGIFDAVTLKKLSNYSEIMFRMALFSRTINNELKNRGFKSIDEVLDPSMKDEIYNRAVAEARSLLDFNQGGTVVKDLESVIPYLNTAVQGTRVAADAFAKNPAMVTAKVLQTGAIASTVIAGISIALISSLRSEDDDDKSNLEIYLDAQEGISQYQKLQYFNIVTGQKDENGEYKIIKVAKNQTMAPIFAFSDNIINHKISDIIGRERKSTKLVYDDIKMAFRNNIMPVDVSSPAGVVTRNPVMKSILTYTTGYDFYRDQPLSNDIGRVEQGAEGQTSSNVDDFYKQIARDYGISAARMKGATESLITTPNTNPFIGLLYSGAEYATTDKDLSGSTKDFAKNFGKSFTKRMVSYTSEFNRTFNKNKEYAEEEAKLRLEGDFRNIDIKIVADQKNDKEISSEEFNERTKKFTPKEKEKLFRRVQDLKRLDKVVDRSIIDIKYEDNSKVRALMIWNRYGDVFDGSKDNQKIIRQMALAKGILTPEVMLEYNKIKKEIKKQKNQP